MAQNKIIVLNNANETIESYWINCSNLVKVGKIRTKGEKSKFKDSHLQAKKVVLSLKYT